jgi:hypothetical protein
MKRPLLPSRARVPTQHNAEEPEGEQADADAEHPVRDVVDHVVQLGVVDGLAGAGIAEVQIAQGQHRTDGRSVETDAEHPEPHSSQDSHHPTMADEFTLEDCQTEGEPIGRSGRLRHGVRRFEAGRSESVVGRSDASLEQTSVHRYRASMPFEPTLGVFASSQAEVVGSFLLEMVLLERAIDRALLDQYARDENRDDFARHFLKRMTLGPKCRAAADAAASVVSRERADEFGNQLRELVATRNAVAHAAPVFTYQIESIPEWIEDDPWMRDPAVVTEARYRHGDEVDLDVEDLVPLIGVSEHVRRFMSDQLHRPLSIEDPNDDSMLQ